MMKYYKDTANTVFVYEGDGSQDKFIPQTLIAITAQEATAILNPPLTAAQKRAQLAPLSAWQVRKVLTQFNLRTQVETALLSADQSTKDAWQYANDFNRDNVLLANMATALGLTDVQLDNLFTVGATL